MGSRGSKKSENEESIESTKKQSEPILQTLYNAAGTCDTEKMKGILLGNFGRLNEDLNEHGRGVIHSAALHGCAETISWVMLNYPGRLKLDKPDAIGSTGLLLAIKNLGEDSEQNDKFQRVIKLLVANNANVNMRNQYGNTPLVWAVRKGHKDTMKMLIEGKAYATSPQSTKSPLAWAAELGANDIVTFLVEQARLQFERMLVSKHSIDEDPGSPNSEASKSSTGERIAIFLQNFVNDVIVKKKDGPSPLMYAINFGHAGVAETLLRFGADCNYSSLDGHTPLTLACRLNPRENKDGEGNDDDQNLTRKEISQLVTILIQARADVDARASKLRLEQLGHQKHSTKQCPTPLMWAVQRSNGEAVDLLLSQGCEVDICNRSKGTFISPLMVSAAKGSIDIAKMLIDKKADINLQSQPDCRTPLIIAAANGHKELVELLLDNDAEPLARDTSGHGPLSRAIERALGSMREYGKHSSTSTRAHLLEAQEKNALVEMMQERRLVTPDDVRLLEMWKVVSQRFKSAHDDA